MSVYKNSKELPAFSIFEDLFHLALNLKWEGENIIKTKPGPIEHENLSLLLAWPGILMIHLSQITGDTRYQKSLNELIGMLNGDTDSDQIRAFLDTIIESKRIPKILFKEVQEAVKNKNNDAHENLRKKIHRYLPRIIVTLLLLLHPKNLSFIKIRFVTLKFEYESFPAECLIFVLGECTDRICDSFRFRLIYIIFSHRLFTL